MGYTFNKPCLDCGKLSRGSRCPEHEEAYKKRRAAVPDSPKRKARKRELYNSVYKKQAAWVRATAVICALCGQGARPADPWQADHIIPGDTTSPLQAAHRSCNASRGNKPINKI